MKKLKITVKGVTYDVEVEVVEDDDDGGVSYGFPTAPIGPTPTTQTPAFSPVEQSPVKQSPVGQGGSKKEVISPLAGTIIEVRVSSGSQVKDNETLLVIEAMKMNTNINSPVSGTVKEVKVQVDNTVQQGQVLVTFE